MVAHGGTDIEASIAIEVGPGTLAAKHLLPA